MEKDFHYDVIYALGKLAELENPEIIAYAKSKGAKGVNLAGMCCTANEILMRHGVPIAGNFLQQELAIITGALEAMVVDVQCIMQGIAEVAKCYHTKIITTDDRAKIQGTTYMHFDESNPIESAKAIVKAAIDNFPNRKPGAIIPKHKSELIAGFSPYRTSHLNRFGLFELKERYPLPVDYGIMFGM